ncbi:MAG: hypothetical protein IKI84_00290 [Clostridia bacterium]|nr:hypothetical protein [Clostridia bacterium]
MKKLQTLNLLLIIFAVVFAAAGLILVLLSIFKGSDTLIPALACVALGNMFNLIRMRTGRMTGARRDA